MRGRTNAEQGGMFLNGTIQQMEIAEDNIISAGDFVEYTKNKAKTSLNKPNMTIGSRIEHLFDNFFLWYDFQAPTFAVKYIKFENGLITTIGTITVATSFAKHEVISNTRLILFTGNSISLISLSSSTLSVLDTKSVTWNNTTNPSFCKLSTDKYINLVTIASSMSGATSWYEITVANDELAVSTKYTSSNGLLTGTSSTKLLNMLYISDNLVALVGGTYNTGGVGVDIGGISFAKFEQGTATMISRFSIYYCGYNSQRRYFLLPSTHNKSLALPYFGDYSTDKKVNFYTFESITEYSTTTIDIFSLLKEAYSNEPIYGQMNPLDPPMSISLVRARNNVYYAIMYPYVEDAHDVLTKNTSIVRLEYDENTATVSVSNTVKFEVSDIVKRTTSTFTSFLYYTGEAIFAEDSNGNVLCVFNTSSDSSRPSSGQYMLKLKYSNGTLSVGEDTEYVQRYTGENPIGVAKNSGTAGDTIGVYIPSSSY